MTRSRVLITLSVIAYSLLLVLAIWLRFALVEGYHPVLEYADEMSRFRNTMLIRHDRPAIAENYGIFTWNPDFDYTGFPPVQLWVHAVAQRWTERAMPFPYPSDYILGARYTSLAASILTAITVALTGWYAALPLGRFPALVSGWSAAMVWAVSPLVLLVSNLALVDPLLYPFVPLMLLFAVMAVRRDQAIWLVFSLLSVIVAIYTKYILIYGLVFPAVGALLLIWERGADGDPVAGWRRFLRGMGRVWGWIALLVAVLGAAVAWLIVVHQMFALSNRETNALYTTGVRDALSISRNWINLSAVINQTTGAIPFVIVLGVGAIVWWRTNRQRSLVIWLTVPLVLLSFPLISSVSVIEGGYRARYTIAPMIVLMIVWGLGTAQVIPTLQKRGSAWVALWLIGVNGAVLLPSMYTNLADIQHYAPAHIREVVWTWSDASLQQPEGKIYILSGQEERWTRHVWDRTEGGYNGATAFEFIHLGDPARFDPRDLYENRDIAYLFLSEGNIGQFPDLPDYLDDLMLLKTFAPAPGTERKSYFYRMVPPEVTVNERFADGITLVGYDLAGTASGESIMFRPFWQAFEAPNANYSMYVHLRPTDDPTAMIAQADGSPVNGTRLTPTWQDPDEILVGDPVTLTLPDELTAGDYTLWVGLYDFTSGERLALVAGGDGYAIPLR